MKKLFGKSSTFCFYNDRNKFFHPPVGKMFPTKGWEPLPWWPPRENCTEFKWSVLMIWLNQAECCSKAASHWANLQLTNSFENMSSKWKYLPWALRLQETLEISKREKGMLEKTKENTRFFSLMWILFGFDLGSKQYSLLGSRCSEGTGNCKFSLGGGSLALCSTRKVKTNKKASWESSLVKGREESSALFRWHKRSTASHTHPRRAAQRRLQNTLQCVGWKHPHQDRPGQPQREGGGPSPRGCFHKTWGPLSRKSFYQ